MSVTSTSVSNANEASYFIQTLFKARPHCYYEPKSKKAGPNSGEIQDIQGYYRQFSEAFGGQLVEKLRERIVEGDSFAETLARIDPTQDWTPLEPRDLVDAVDDPKEAGSLIEALVRIADRFELYTSEVAGIRSYFDEYEQKFGKPFIEDLRGRVADKGLSAYAMNQVAPEYFPKVPKP